MSEWMFRFQDEDVQWCQGYVKWKLEQVAAWRKSKGYEVKNYDAYAAEKKFATELRGVMGEYAAAIVLGIGMVTDLRERKKGDLEHGIEVRTVENPRYGLTFNERDAMNRAYICVHLSGRLATLKGWARFTEETKAKCKTYEWPAGDGKTQRGYSLPDIHLEPMMAMRTRLDQLRQGM